MLRCARIAPLLLVIGTSCAGVRSNVRFEPAPDAPALRPRPEGCHVDIHELGNEVTRPHKVVGSLVLEASQDELRDVGGQGISDRLRAAACANGAFIVKDLKAYPNSVTGGVLYEAKAAVILDERGNILGNEPAAAGGDAGAP